MNLSMLCSNLVLKKGHSVIESNVVKFMCNSGHLLFQQYQNIGFSLQNISVVSAISKYTIGVGYASDTNSLPFLEYWGFIEI